MVICSLATAMRRNDCFQKANASMLAIPLPLVDNACSSSVPSDCTCVTYPFVVVFNHCQHLLCCTIEDLCWIIT